MENLIAKIKIEQVDLQTYKPRLKQLFGNKNATYAFEGGKRMRLLRLLDGKRTHDFVLYNIHVKEKTITIETEKFDYAALIFESYNDIKNLFASLPCFPNYERSINGEIYTPTGEQMSSEQIKNYINSKINP